MFKTFDLVAKFGCLHIGTLAKQSTFARIGSQFPTSATPFTVATNIRTFANKEAVSERLKLPPPPKRSLNVFALFVKDQFQKYPSDMTVKDKFIRAGQDWRSLSEDEKEVYKKLTAESFVQYRKDMNDYFNSLSAEAKAQYQQLVKVRVHPRNKLNVEIFLQDKTKEKARHRIKLKLRKLNYPKKNRSAYNFFVQEQLKLKYPDGKYPSIRTPEHIRQIGIWSQMWRNTNTEGRKPYTDLAEADRARYFDELEKWKQELAKPENEEDFLQLERLSKKVEACSKNAEQLKAKQRKTAAKIAKSRALKKTAQKKKKKTKVSAKKKLISAKSK